MDRIKKIRELYLQVSDDAVFMERALIIRDAETDFRELPRWEKQGMILRTLGERLTPVVDECDLLLGRLREEIPDEAGRQLLKERPELFIEAGVPGLLDSVGLYAPDWEKLLRQGLGGLRREVEQTPARNPGHADWLRGVALALEGIALFARRYARAAGALAAQAADPASAANLLAAAGAAERVASEAPEHFREALQLYLFFHIELSCLAGGRNITPGRMDRWLAPFYQKDLADGLLAADQAAELLAAAMVMLSQLSGEFSTDFQSKKATPNRYSHYYITVGGLNPGGEYEINALSFAILRALKAVQFREPTVEIRYAPGIDEKFWHEALELLRRGFPIILFNDQTVIPALRHFGVTEADACNYVHCGCLNVILPGCGTPGWRYNHNTPAALLALIGRIAGGAEKNAPHTFHAFLADLREQCRAELTATLAGFQQGEVWNRRFPLPAAALFRDALEAGEDYCRRRQSPLDIHLTGLASVIDSLLVIRKMVYFDNMITFAELDRLLKTNFAGGEALRRRILNRPASYGSDEREVMEMIELVSSMWIELVGGLCTLQIRPRPGFHSWLYNILMGKETGALPDGRRAGEPFSSDLLPSPGRSLSPTELLHCMAALPHRTTPSGGTTFELDASLLRGEAGLERLSALLKAYFAAGGLHLHFVPADQKTLIDAVEHPDKHCDLLVRVTGFSEYFVRLLPEVQRNVIKRHTPAATFAAPKRD